MNVVTVSLPVNILRLDRELQLLYSCSILTMLIDMFYLASMAIGM